MKRYPSNEDFETQKICLALMAAYKYNTDLRDNPLESKLLLWMCETSGIFPHARAATEASSHIVCMNNIWFYFSNYTRDFFFCYFRYRNKSNSIFFNMASNGSISYNKLVQYYLLHPCSIELIWHTTFSAPLYVLLERIWSTFILFTSSSPFLL